jgi:hypothetical protein
MKFRATVLLEGKTATGIEVPPEIVDALGTSKKPPVHVTIGAHSYRSTVAVMGGKFMIPLSAANRELAGVAAGDVVEVDVRPDNELRVLALPDDFVAALAAAPAAKAAFEKLSFSKQRALVDPVTGAKAADTRERRIAKAIASLTE